MGDVRQAQGQPGQQVGPPPGTRVFVDVYADTAPNGSVVWSHKWRFADQPENGGEIVVPAKDKGQPGTPIQFKLHDRTQPKVGLTFVPSDEAIWVDRVDCPNASIHDAEIANIEPSETVLKLLDLNNDECTLHYNLRFNPDPIRYCYDPTIKNGGTTTA